ncbi:MAG: Hint domain-containing protein [Silicimonas sp.]|nr:Hint domain-containing protein [Silicimonas sp.]
MPDLPSRVRSEPAWTVPRRTVSRIPVSQKPVHPRARVTRRFEYEWLEHGLVRAEVSVAPALPAFEAAFNAFTHGALIQTSEGPVAVEDLSPGMMLESADGRHSQLLWKGSINLVPGAPTLGDEPRLYRVMSDAFGLGRPVQDQTFGPGARRLDRDPKFHATVGAKAALVPLTAIADGHAVIEVTPLSPTRVYHLACETHETILAAGLEVETFHPGPETPISLPEEMLALFMQFFPHLGTVRDFGRLDTPRVTADEFFAMSA